MYRDSITHQVHAECKSNPQMDPARYRAQCPLPRLISHQSVSEPAVIHVHQRLISLYSHMPSAPQKLPQQPTNESPCHSSQADSTSGGSRRRARQGEGGRQNWSRNVWISVPTQAGCSHSPNCSRGTGNCFSESVPACNCPAAFELQLSQSVTGMGQSRKQQHQSTVCFSPGSKLNAEIREGL